MTIDGGSGARPGYSSPSFILLPALLFALAILAAACGSGSEASLPVTSEAPTSESQSQADPPASKAPAEAKAEDQAETFNDVLTRFSQCVRDRGYAVKDLTLEAVVDALLSGGPGNDPRGIDGAVDPILANALGLDPDDVEVLDAVNSCADDVQAGISELELS